MLSKKLLLLLLLSLLLATSLYGIASPLTAGITHHAIPGKQIADNQPQAGTQSEIPAKIQSGDLVFRAGDEEISTIIHQLDHSGYSHVGMIYKTADGIKVIHATPSEQPNQPDMVIIDSLAFFRHHAKHQQLDFYLINASPQQHAIAVNYALQQAGKPFGFTEQHFYCTQLVYQAWQQAGVNIISNKPWRKLPFLPMPILLPEQIIESANLQRLRHESP